jgi:hypothetical protein
MERKTPSIMILLASLALGLVGYFFFNERDLGVSVPIYVGIALATIIAFAVREGMELSFRRLWLLIPILFFAMCFFVRANSTILLLNGVAILTLGAVMTNHFSQKYLDEVGWFDYLGAIVYAVFTVMFRALGEIAQVFAWLTSRPKKAVSPQWISIIRGIFLALPIVFIFAVLLSSADPIFQENLLQFSRFFDNGINLDGLIQFVVITGAISWFMTGAILFSISPTQLRRDESSPEEADIDKQAPKFLRLNMTEAGIVLGGVVALFAFFVFIQFTYLFGQQTIFLETMTFANYARRGFFELVAVSLMTLGLMLGLDRSTLKRAQSQQVFFRFACVVLVSLTLVILASAWRRMGLYEEAYGFSHLRYYVHVFMFWLGVLLLVALLDIFRVRAHIFSLGALLVLIAYLVTLNIINVDATIAQHNIERYHAGEELDVCYFSSMSADAVPVIAELYSRMEEGELYQSIGHWLGYHRSMELSRHFDGSILEANLSHDAALESTANRSINTDEGTRCYYQG